VRSRLKAVSSDNCSHYKYTTQFVASALQNKGKGHTAKINAAMQIKERA